MTIIKQKPRPQPRGAEDKLLSPEDAAKFYCDYFGVPISVDSLNTLRSRGGGPAFVRVGKQIAYPVASIVAYGENRTSRPMASTSKAVEA